MTRDMLSTGPIFLHLSATRYRAANVVQFVFGILAAGVCLAFRDLRRRSWPLVVTALTGYLLYSGLIRYQTWGGRLIVPLIAQCAVFVAIALSVLNARRQRIAGLIVVGICIVQAGPWLFVQKWRPIVGSDSTITRGDIGDLTASVSRSKAAQFSDALTAINSIQPRSVGLAGAFSYRLEYIWWRDLRTRIWQAPAHFARLRS